VNLSIPGVLGEAWGLYTRNSGRLTGVAALVFGLLSLVQAAIDTTGVQALLAVSAGVTILGALWLQGALVVVVDDLRDGRIDLTVGQVFRRVEPRLWTLLAVGIIAAVGVAGGLILFIVPGLVLLTYWSLTVPAVVIETRGVIDAFKRSMRLVSGDALRVFAVILITVALATIIAYTILILLSPLPEFFDVYVAGVVANAITMPFVALSWTLMFFDLRLNKG
jgi:hypothetical protein